jgi:hypothetical protein
MQYLPAPNTPQRVLGIAPTLDSAAYYRLIVPLSLRNDATWGTWDQWDRVSQAQLDACEVVVISRLAGSAKDVAAMLADFRERGKRIIVDYDDDWFSIAPHNHVARDSGVQGVRVALRHADRVIVTNAHLAHIYRRETDRPIEVVPNLIEPAWWTAQPQSLRCVTIGVFGSQSHLRDWARLADVLAYIKRRFPVRIVLGGSDPSALRPLADSIMAWTNDLATYQRNLSQVQIGLAPLDDTRFNRSKSPVKAFEYALAGAAVIGSPTQYAPILADGRGIVADTPAEWRDALIHFLEAPDVRQQAAQRLRAWIVQTWHRAAYRDQIAMAYA